LHVTGFAFLLIDIARLEAALIADPGSVLNTPHGDHA